MTNNYLALQDEARYLAQQLFGSESEKVIKFADRLLDISTRVQDKNLLLIHNSGGWGSADLNHCLRWERNLVAGVNTTIDRLGHTSLLIDYLRTGKGWREKIQDVKEQFQFFPSKAKILAAELEFITRHTNHLKVILIGISQGAAFSNAVIQNLSELDQAYSIELGIPFVYVSRRVVNKRTLAIDSNGLMLDPVVHRSLAVLRAWIVGPFIWLRYQLQGKPVRFAQCINAPGHDYDWSYPKVQRQIVDFLGINFGTGVK